MIAAKQTIPRISYDKFFVGTLYRNTISTVVVKDLSRLGREYLQTGYYSEIFFPMHDVRFIAINDGVDTANGENEFAPFKNLLNEMYAKDISRKIKSSARIRAKRGEFVNGTPPYGYMRDPDNRNNLIPDRNTAPTVKMMFDLAAEGKSSYAISIILARYGERYKDRFVSMTYDAFFKSILDRFYRALLEDYSIDINYEIADSDAILQAFLLGDYSELQYF